MKPSDNVMYVGFDYNNILVMGDVYCVTSNSKNQLRIHGYDIAFDRSNFIAYDHAKSFQDYDTSEIDPYGYGDWRIFELPNINSRLRLRLLNTIKTEDRIKSISFDDVQWFGFDEPVSKRGIQCRCCGGQRTIMADLNYPGILLDGTSTYSGRRYRSMDGRHRIEKYIHFGYTSGKFYVFHLDEVIKYFTEI